MRIGVEGELESRAPIGKCGAGRGIHRKGRRLRNMKI